MRAWMLALLLAVPGWAAADCRAALDRAARSVVLIEGQGVYGSGVVIGHNRVLTAAHVVAGLDHIWVRVAGERRAASLVTRRPDDDLALLVAPTGDLPALPLARAPLAPGETVWAVGYPRGGPQRRGRGQFDYRRDGALYTSAPVDFGQSGGALLRCDGRRATLAGIVRAFGAERVDGELRRLDDLSVATAGTRVRDFLRHGAPLARVLMRFLHPAESVARAD